MSSDIVLAENIISTLDSSNEIIYHYTNFKGLDGIIRDRAIWATDVLYLNDSMELNHTFDLIDDVLEDYKNKSGLEGKLNELMSLRLKCKFTESTNPSDLENINLQKLKILELEKYFNINLLINTLKDFRKLGHRMPIFASCFSKKEDQLSQWRGYADKSIGFCIGFYIHDINEICVKYNMDLVPCIYNHSDKIRIISEWLNRT